MTISIVRFIAVASVTALATAFAQAGEQAVPETLPRPLTLEKALDYALRHNPTLNRVREQIREQEGVLVSTQARLLPQVGLTAQQTRTERDLLSVAGGSRDAWQVEARATQVLYAGGALAASSAAQRLQVEVSRLTVQAQAADTVLAVRQAFCAVLLNRELVAVQEAELAVLEKEASDAALRREAGNGSDFDVLRADVAVANAKPVLIHVRNALRTTTDRLRLELGAAPARTGEPAVLVEGTLGTAAATPSLDAALTAAKASRPEILRQGLLQKAADKGLSVAKAGYKPTVSAFAAYDWVSNPYSTTWGRRLDGATAGVQASINIFDGRATAGKVRQARSQARQLAHGADELTLAVDYQVRVAHAALEEAAELLLSAEMTVSRATESLRLARARQSAGAATQLDVLTAQTALTQARSTLSNARHDHQVAAAQLEKATGVALPVLAAN